LKLSVRTLRVLNVDTIAQSRMFPSGFIGTFNRAPSASYVASLGVWKLTRLRSLPAVVKVCR
jgi:hypothetical protein